MAACTWVDIRSEVMRSKPQVDCCLELYKFVMNYAGGKEGSYLLQTDEFCRAHGEPSRKFLAVVVNLWLDMLENTQYTYMIYHSQAGFYSPVLFAGHSSQLFFENSPEWHS